MRTVEAGTQEEGGVMLTKEERLARLCGEAPHE